MTWQAIQVLFAATVPFFPLLVAAPVSATPALPRVEHIEVDPGIHLAADVYKSRTPGRSPLIVIPPGYGLPSLLNTVSAAKLADLGYDVVVYTPRGQWASNGANNLVSATDVEDVSKIIDWAETYLDSDITRVGITGISQGSIISLMAAAHDPRIRAVVAMSTSSRINTPLIVNNTWFEQFMLLVKAGQIVNPFGPDLATVVDKFDRNDRSDLTGFMSSRSPESRVAELNKNGAAIMIANGWQDSAFPPSGVTDFFEQLTTPKRMMLMPGDHVIPELGGLAGAPNESWDAAGQWFDHYLKDVDNGVDKGKPVQLQPMFGGPFIGFDSWPAVVAPMDRLNLSPTTDTADTTGVLGARSATPWSTSIEGGPDPAADSGPLILSGMGAPRNLPVPGFLAAVDRSKAMIWESAPTATDRAISGAPKLTLTATPSDSAFSIFGYLYDVDPNGHAALLGHVPYTATGVTPGVPTSIDVSLEPMRHTVAAGHRLALVIDTDDQRYRSETGLGELLSFESTPANPAALEIPWESIAET